MRTFFVCFCKFNSFRFATCLNQISCNGGKAGGETTKSNRKSFFQHKCFWSEPKTFTSFSSVLFIKKYEGNKRRNTKSLVKKFKFLFYFSRFTRACTVKIRLLYEFCTRSCKIYTNLLFALTYLLWLIYNRRT